MGRFVGHLQGRARAARLGDLGGMLLALLLGGLATDATDVATSSYAGVDATIGLVAIAALWWRRRAPRLVAGLAFVAAAAAPLAAGSAVVAMFTLVAHGQHARGTTAIPVLYVLYLGAGVVSLLAFPDQDLSAVQSALVGLVLTVAAVGWGAAVRARREALDALTERAERAEADQHARMEEARRAERTRIAAEMHDVLAHRLAMLSLAAGAIEYRPDRPREELARAATSVRSSARSALDDLRRVIGVLRQDALAATTPLPTAVDLERLLDQSRAAGMVIELEVDPSLQALRDVPAELGRHAYRVVQEGLTNAHKHAPGQPVRLRLAASPGTSLDIEVVNPTTSTVSGLPGSGLGLVGMQERVTLARGTLETRRDGRGHYVLRASLPWPRA